MKKIIITLLMLWSSISYALDIECTDCLQTTVQTAVTSVKNAGGGTVYLPACEESWSTDVNVGGNVNIIGRTKRNSSAWGASSWDSLTKIVATTSARIFDYTGNTGSTSSRISGITFLRTVSSTNFFIDIRCTDFFQVDNCIFNDSDHSIRGQAIQWKSQSKGLIYDNYFYYPNASLAGGSYYGVTAGMPELTDSATCPDDVCNCSVGDESGDRASSVASGNTVITATPAVIDNAGGSGTGTVRRVYINLATANEGATITLASFSKGTGNVFSARAKSEAISVVAGKNILWYDDSAFTPFSIYNGDYLGVYLNGCTIDATTGLSAWTVSGDQTSASSVTFTANISAASIWGEIFDTEGDYEECEDRFESDWDNLNRGCGTYLGFDENFKPTATNDTAIFVEDNEFYWGKTAFDGNWGGSSAHVLRHNYFHHATGEVFGGNKPGNVFFMVYDNIFEQDSGALGNVFNIRTNGLVYDNTFRYMSSSFMLTQLRYYSSYTFTPQTRMKRLYIYNNTYQNSSISTDEEGISWEGEGGITPLTWLGVDKNVFFRAPQAGELLYGFEEYAYPHPLRGSVPPPPTPSQSGLNFGSGGSGGGGKIN